MATAKFAAPGSAGALADRIGWIDFGPGFTLVTGAAPVHVQNTLPDGFTVDFDIQSTNQLGPSTNFDAVFPPAFFGSAFGNTGYTGIAGNVVMYLRFPAGLVLTQETILITNIVVTNSKGVSTTTYRWVTADAENTDTGEILSTTTNGSPWELLDNLPPLAGGLPLGPLISGVGTVTALETGTSLDSLRSSGPVFITNSPTTISALTSTLARQGFAFGIVITAREQAISDLIESIALEQAALSHILNAEGEKIQKIITIGSISEILAINKSVQDMINTISHLELILESKLSIFPCDLCPDN